MKANFSQLLEIKKLDGLFQESHIRPVVFFKHSETCPISRNVLDEVSNVAGQIWLVVVQESRLVSDAIAEKTDIKHESPQTIVVRNGNPIYHSSHYDISARDIMKALSGEATEI